MTVLTDDPERVFSAPWEAHAFALTVKLHEQGHFSWKEWSERLSDALSRASRDADSISAGYYAAWLEALERLLLEKNLLDAEEIVRKLREL